MKAIICTKYGPPEVLKLKDVETPTPKHNEVRIKIYATAVTGSDIMVRSSNVKKSLWLPMRIAIGFTRPRNPILGMVLAGEIESTGKDVKIFKTGDKVFGMTLKTPSQTRHGTYAEYKCLPENSHIIKIPSNATYEAAAAIPYGGLLALFYLRKGGIKSGQNVLIYGASGAVGTSAVQLARYFGAKVTGICSTTNLEMVKSLGADIVIDYTSEDFTKRNVFYDFILEAVPSGMIDQKTLKTQCLKSLSPGGKFISIKDGRPNMTAIEGLTLLKQLFEIGKFKPVIDRCYPLDQIAEAHRYVEKGHKKGNVVIKIN